MSLSPYSSFIHLTLIIFQFGGVDVQFVGRSVVGTKVLPCKAKERIPCAMICGVTITFQSCDVDEGYCNCPSPCPSALKGSLYICGKCRKPSNNQRDSCHFGNCRSPKSEALVCTDGKNSYCTCFPRVSKKFQRSELQGDSQSSQTAQDPETHDEGWTDEDPTEDHS